VRGELRAFGGYIKCCRGRQSILVYFFDISIFQTNSIIDENEESQLMAAIQATLKQSKSASTIVVSSDSENSADSAESDSDDNLETFSDSDSVSTVANHGDSPGTVSKTSNLGTISTSELLDSDSNTRDSCASSSSKRVSQAKKNGKGKGKRSKNNRDVSLKNGSCSKSTVTDTDDDSRLSRITNVDSQESSCSTQAPPGESWEDYLGSENGTMFIFCGLLYYYYIVSSSYFFLLGLVFHWEKKY
jgi:hypothetical protein